MICAILQARTDSTRLPNKVLMPILKIPMIVIQIERILQSKKIESLIVATSDEKSDDKLANLLIEHGYNVFRGSRDNVLNRFVEATKHLKDEDIIVRLTGDCPLMDAKIIDETIDKLKEFDYVANCITPIYPDGFDVEVFTSKTLRQCQQEASLKSEFEHVTPHIRISKKFKTANVQKEAVYPSWRLTVDEQSDFMLISAVFEHFGRIIFSFEDIVDFLEKNSHLLEINSHINRNEGYTKSLREDKNAR